MYHLFCPKGTFLSICVLCQCIVCRIPFQNMHTFSYQKTLLHTLLLLVFKIVESLQCILKNFQISQESTCVVSESLFNKVTGLKACNFIKKRLQHSRVPVKYAKFLRTPFFTEHLRWLFL